MSKQTPLQKHRIRFYYTASTVMWIAIGFHVYGWLASSYGVIMVSFMAMFASWSIQTVVFTSANEPGSPMKGKE